MGRTAYTIHAKFMGWAVAFLLTALALFSCAHQQCQLSVSQYSFTLVDESYRIRSIISPVKSESHNEIIGQKFVAADYDQDGVLDCVTMGEVALAEAQKIYDYGLNGVSRENKLKVQNPDIHSYFQEQDNVQLEIRSFQPINAPPFTEFRVVDTRARVHIEVVVLLDENADGMLDEILKGSGSLEKLQSQYAELIQAGLQKGELIKVNGKILVREK